MDKLTSDLTGIALAIIGLATLTVLVRQGSNTAQVIRETGGAFGNVLNTAMGGNGYY